MIITQKLTDNAYGYKDDRFLDRWIDAFGSVQKALIDSTWRANDWTVTATGTSPITASVVPDSVALITTAATEFAGDNIQFTGSQFALAIGKPCYFGAKISVSDATQTDLLIGLCGVDTTLTAASVAHGVAVSAGGVFFSKLDASTTAYFKTYAAAAETNSAAAFTLDIAPHVYEFFYDGVSFIHAYVDGVKVAAFSSIPTDVLTPSLSFRAGEAVAKTCTVHWMRAIQGRE
jgi:hypothetical protein